MATVTTPWAPVGGSHDHTFTAALQTPGGVLLLTVSQSVGDRLWRAVVEEKNDFGPTSRCPSPFVTRILAQQWAEREAEKMAREMLPFPAEGES